MATEQRSDGEPADPKTVTIIRYPNRRLYDRSQGKYVTLNDVEETVRRGGTVTVRDSKTGEDLTRSLLAQIILERHPERMEMIPVHFLHLIIQANEVMLGSLRENVKKSLAYFDLMQRAATFNPLAVPTTLMNAFFSGLPAPEQAKPPSPTGPDAMALIADLERRLEELEATTGRKAANQKPNQSHPGAEE